MIGLDPAPPASLLQPDEAPERADSAALFDSVYRELHRLAVRQMAAQPPGHTLQPTALVSEAYLRLAPHVEGMRSTEHFLRVAARAMRQVLLDHGRRRQAEKRVPRHRRVDLDVALDHLYESFDDTDEGIVRVERALSTLEKVDPDLAAVVELHHYGGQTLAKVAEVQGISERQAHRRLRAARAFIRRELDHEADASKEDETRSAQG